MKIIIYILFLINIIFGQQNNNFDIANILVYGNIEISENDVINFSGLSPNTSITSTDIGNAINRLWLLNRFQNIQIDFEQNYEKTNLIINVEEIPILDQIIFDGNYFKFQLFKFKKSKSELKNISSLNTGMVLSQQQINSAITLIKQDFIKRNYHNIEIEYSLKNSTDNNKKNIAFHIDVNSKSKIEDIQILVNDKELKSNKISELINKVFKIKNSDFTKNKILKILKQAGDIKVKKWYLPWTGHYDNQKLENMTLGLISYYRSQGYLDFSVLDYSIINKNNLSIKIDTGNKYYINDINFYGNYIFLDSIIKSNIGFEKGDFFSGIKFDQSNLRLNNLYRDQGYLFTQIIPSFIPISKDSLDIIFDFNEKSIVTVNQIIIRGNNTTKENVIRRDIDIFPNQVFSQSDVMDSYRKLAMLNYFESIVPNIKKINDEKVDIVFEVTEKGSGQLNFSAGYSGIHGFQGGGGFLFPNFLGTGQILNLEYQRGISNQQSVMPENQNSSKPNQTFSISYTEPRLFDTSNLVGLSLKYEEQGPGNSMYYSLPFDTNKLSGGIRLGRKFKWPDKFFNGTWSFGGIQRDYIASDSLALASYYSSIADEIRLENNQYKLTTSGLRISQVIKRDERDNIEFPTQGSTFIWNSIFSGGFLGGNEDYYKNEFTFKWYNEIFDKFVVHQNFKMGFLNPIDSPGQSIIPYGAKFKLGGTGLSGGEMLRGYGENMVGPLGSSYPKGGNALLKYSLELRYLVSNSPTMYLLIFGDAGNVWDKFEFVDPFSLRRSMGIGVRVMMPMLGTLGYDIAYGFDPSIQEYLNGNNSAHGWEYHFIFGLPIY